ncbi:hypothetical protein AB0K16_20490 [Nonomuraea jabiensis]|uniref:hypothetical protein n=1 Tax=Nonomuraea jabiensis TaxID=882448 RepID=UPI0034290623
MYGKRDQTRSDHLGQVANWRAMNLQARPEADAETGAEPGTGQVDDGEDALGADIAQFVAMTRTGPWLLAYLGARRVAPGEGNGVGFEQQSTKCFDRNTFRRISAREFARRAGTSAKRVMALLEAWNRLAAGRRQGWAPARRSPDGCQAGRGRARGGQPPDSATRRTRWDCACWRSRCRCHH